MQSFKILLLALGMIVAATSSKAASNYNLALNKVATQISTGYGGDASRAVDGNATGSFGDGTVSHTGSEIPENWWQVDLGALKYIRTINAWNRPECCAFRATDYYIFVSDVPFTSTTIAGTLAQPGVSAYHDPGQMGYPSTFNIGRNGRYVRVQLAPAYFLHMAEVEVYGDDDVKSLIVDKTASPRLEVAKGQVVTYTYKITNNGTIALSNVKLSDVHNGYGTPPVPKNEVLTDNAPIGDSSDVTANNGVWSNLGPGDIVTMTGTYTVVQNDIELRQ